MVGPELALLGHGQQQQQPGLLGRLRSQILMLAGLSSWKSDIMGANETMTMTDTGVNAMRNLILLQNEIIGPKFFLSVAEFDN